MKRIAGRGGRSLSATYHETRKTDKLLLTIDELYITPVTRNMRDGARSVFIKKLINYTVPKRMATQQAALPDRAVSVSLHTRKRKLTQPAVYKERFHKQQFHQLLTTTTSLNVRFLRFTCICTGIRSRSVSTWLMIPTRLPCR